jgi:RNA ligase
VVWDRLDGSLAIAYPWYGRTVMHTRGSFVSDQARAAQAWLDERVPDGLAIARGTTWLFEWIAPDNRIVVDHGSRRELVLLAVTDNATGRDRPRPDAAAWPGGRAARSELGSIDAVVAAERPGEEGYVVAFAGGLRVTVKSAEYIRLDRLVTGVSARTSWEVLSAGDPIEPLLEAEFYRWVAATRDRLLGEFAAIEAAAQEAFAGLADLRSDRRAFAAAALAPPWAAVLFRLLDDRPYDALIRRQIRPAADRPFREDDL